jgi:hypothetical protein
MSSVFERKTRQRIDQATRESLGIDCGFRIFENRKSWAGQEDDRSKASCFRAT